MARGGNPTEDMGTLSQRLHMCIFLSEPQRNTLQAVTRAYVDEQLSMLSRHVSIEEQQSFKRRNRRACNRMTEIVAVAVADGTPIVVPLTSTTAARLASYDEVLPWSIIALLLLSAVVPSLLMGRLQSASGTPRISGGLFFVGLVTLVIFVTIDLCQPRRRPIRVNREPLERVV